MAKYPEIGEMTQRITFQRPVTSDDGGGGKVIKYVDVAEVWAKVEPISSRERFFAGQNVAEVTHKIAVRHRADVKNDWRIRHGEVHYTIDSIIDMGGTRRFLELLCTETKENG